MRIKVHLAQWRLQGIAPAIDGEASTEKPSPTGPATPILRAGGCR